MLKNPFDRFKLCVGGSGEAGFSSGSATGDSSYDSGSGSVSSAPGVSTNPATSAPSNNDSGSSPAGSAEWYASEIASREAAARANTIDAPISNDSGSTPTTYTDPRTGLVFATPALAESSGYGALITSGGRTDTYAQGLAALTTRAEQDRYMQRNDDPLAGAGIGARYAETGVVDASSKYLNRPEIYAVTDKKQQELVGQGLTPYQAAEQLRNQATTNREAEYYETLRTQAWTTTTGKSAAYHTWAKDTNLPQKANPYEYVADLFTYAEKGYPTRDKEVFSAVDYTVLGLPEGKGGQAYIWNNEPYDLRGAMDVIARTERTGEMGPYGKLGVFSSGAGMLTLETQQGIAAKAATSVYRNTPETISYSVWGAPSGRGESFMVTAPASRGSVSAGLAQVQGMVDTDAGLVKAPFTSVGESGVVVAPPLTGFDKFQSDISESLYGAYGNLFGLTDDQAKQGVKYASLSTRELANMAPSTTNVALSAGVSDVQRGVDKPVQAGAELVIGIAFGAGWRAVEGAYGASRALAAESIISRGQGARAADIFGNFVMSNAPKALAGIYAVDIGARSTEGFSTFKGGDVSANIAPILTYETAPLVVGSVIGYSAPEMAGFAYRSIVKTPGKVSDAIFETRQNLAGFTREPHGTTTYDMTIEPGVSGPGRVDYNIPSDSPYAKGDWNWGKKRLTSGSPVISEPTPNMIPRAAFEGVNTPTGGMRLRMVETLYEPPTRTPPLDYTPQMQPEVQAEPTRKLGYKPASTFDFNKYIRPETEDMSVSVRTQDGAISQRMTLEQELMNNLARENGMIIQSDLVMASLEGKTKPAEVIVNPSPPLYRVRDARTMGREVVTSSVPATALWVTRITSPESTTKTTMLTSPFTAPAPATSYAPSPTTVSNPFRNVDPNITMNPPRSIPPFQPVMPPLPDFGFGGGGSFGGGRRRGRKFVEVFNVGLDLATFGPKAYNPLGGRSGGKPRKTKARKKK